MIRVNEFLGITVIDRTLRDVNVEHPSGIVILYGDTTAIRTAVAFQLHADEPWYLEQFIGDNNKGTFPAVIAEAIAYSSKELYHDVSGTWIKDSWSAVTDVRHMLPEDVYREELKNMVTFCFTGQVTDSVIYSEGNVALSKIHLDSLHSNAAYASRVCGVRPNRTRVTIRHISGGALSHRHDNFYNVEGISLLPDSLWGEFLDGILESKRLKIMDALVKDHCKRFDVVDVTHLELSDDRGYRTQITL